MTDVVFRSTFSRHAGHVDLFVHNLNLWRRQTHKTKASLLRATRTTLTWRLHAATEEPNPQTVSLQHQVGGRCWQRGWGPSTVTVGKCRKWSKFHVRKWFSYSASFHMHCYVSSSVTSSQPLPADCLSTQSPQSLGWGQLRATGRRHTLFVSAQKPVAYIFIWGRGLKIFFVAWNQVGEQTSTHRTHARCLRGQSGWSRNTDHKQSQQSCQAYVRSWALHKADSSFCIIYSTIFPPPLVKMRACVVQTHTNI